MGIEAIKDQKIFILNTKSSTYMMKADETGLLRHVYYGAKVPERDMSYLQAERDRGFSGNPYEKKLDRGFSFDTIPQEIREYHIYSSLILNGEYYRLKALRADPSRTMAESLPTVDYQCWEFVSEDKEAGQESARTYRKGVGASGAGFKGA